MSKNLSRVEVKGPEAFFYDILMEVITFGRYGKFIHSALSEIKLFNNAKLLDMGSGTARNILILDKYARKSKIRVNFIGVDKGKIMLKKALKRTEKFDNIKILERDIRKDLKLEEKFDIGLISFVLHGFEQKNRDKILNNFSEKIRESGRLYIIDYNELDTHQASLFVKFFYKTVECPLAADFVSRNLEKMLSKHNFKIKNNYYYFRNLIRVAEAEKI